jgi:hypothetical protein
MSFDFRDARLIAARNLTTVHRIHYYNKGILFFC